MPPARDEIVSQPASHQVLTQFDCICIIVGTIIGAGIFKMPAVVASYVPSIYALTGVWVCGGIIALIGALCFAELTTTYPDRGGDYGYLNRAYHRRIGFTFAWAAFWIIRPGNIGAMAMIFGLFAIQLFPGSYSAFTYAIGGVVATTMMNLLGVRFGKTTQNILSVAKVAGILLVVASAFAFWPNADAKRNQTDPSTTLSRSESGPLAENQLPPGDGDRNVTQPALAEPVSGWFWLALMFVMFTFGGWNDIAFVACEVREPKQNLLPALTIGTLVVLLVYLLVNFSLLFGLGFQRLEMLGQQSQSASAALISENMGAMGNRLFAALVCVSCLGAINAMVFTSPRIYWATAADYPALRWLAGGDRGRGWWRAMLLQAMITLVFVVTFGQTDDGLDNIVAATAPYFWSFLALTIVSLIVCRIRFKGEFTGYRVPFGPVMPLVFVSACGFMTYRAFLFMAEKDLGQHTVSIGLWVLLGFGLSFTLKHRRDE